MEGETIKKKYMTILDMLKKERLTFGNQIEGLEAQLKKQDEEIDKLKVRIVLYKECYHIFQLSKYSSRCLPVSLNNRTTTCNGPFSLARTAGFLFLG